MLKGSAEARQKKKDEKERREKKQVRSSLFLLSLKCVSIQADEHAALAASFAANPTEFVSKIRKSIEDAKKRRHERTVANSALTSAATASGRRTAAANRQRAAVITDMGRFHYYLLFVIH